MFKVIQYVKNHTLCMVLDHSILKTIKRQGVVTMSSIKDEIKNIKNSAKQIGEVSKDTGKEVGKAYAEMGKETAKKFKDLYGKDK